jgi:hypothetical protein
MTRRANCEPETQDSKPETYDVWEACVPGGARNHGDISQSNTDASP